MFHLSPPLPAPVVRFLPMPPMPLAAGSAVLSRLSRSIAARHPSLLRRMGDAAERRFLIHLADLPLLILMEPAAQRLSLHLAASPPRHDAAIRGRLAAFLTMLHGQADGDALFFSGDLSISGDTGAVLALRNALDDAELDLTEELAACAGPVAAALRRFARLVERGSGLRLHRDTPTPPEDFG